MTTQELQAFRKQLYTDLYSNRIPARVPVQDGLGIEFLVQYAGKDLLTTQYSYSDEILEEIYEKAAKELMRGDILGAVFARNAVANMLDGNIGNQMGSNGMIQHPEICYMQPEEYDEMIENPFDFYLEKISTRTCAEFQKGPVFRSRALTLRTLANMDQGAMFGRIARKLVKEYGFHSEPAGSSSIAQPPFDMIADFMRGFSKIPMDMRRCPEKLMAAMDAFMPYLLAMSVPANPNLLGSAKVMTHMAAYLSNKQFEKFYFPHFNEMTHINLARDIYMTMFLEQDWTRFIDYLQDMPMGTRFYMECGDMQQFKDKMGKKFVLGGFYPLEFLRSGTKEQCIDKAKQILDIMAPGGNYFFCWGKSALSLNDINVENYLGVMEYVRDNYHYDNAGEQVSDMVQKDTIRYELADKYPPFKSKYVLSFDDYKKEYPPISPEVEPLMRKAYDKYWKMIALNRNC